MSDLLRVQSHKGPYAVESVPPFRGLEDGLAPGDHLVIDAKVAALYSEILGKALQSPWVLRVEATEENKSLEKMAGTVLALTEQGIKRGGRIVAVGGGIVQDIVSFLAAILFRGMDWIFYPTTLLAQADSCIGSKSSINVGGFKNQVGTFTPPKRIFLSTQVLDTLPESDFRSGIGEIIKVHWIAGEEDFRGLAGDYNRLFGDKEVLEKRILRSLEIKKRLVERDEFDRNERLILNYGHSFGHAIESATAYRIPHGIAVTLGMAIANRVSEAFGLLKRADREAMEPLLKKNARGFEKTEVPFGPFFEALRKDKKNQAGEVTLILSRGPGDVFRGRYPADGALENLLRKSLREIREAS